MVGLKGVVDVDWRKDECAAVSREREGDTQRHMTASVEWVGSLISRTILYHPTQAYARTPRIEGVDARGHCT